MRRYYNRSRELRRWLNHKLQAVREYFERFNLGLLRRLVPYAKPYLGLEVVMFAAMLVAVLIEQASPLLMRGLIDQAKRERQAAEITETEYFQGLQQKAQQLRRTTQEE